MSSAGRGFYAGTRSFSWLAELTRLPIDQVNFLVCQFTALVFAILYRKVFSPQNVSAEIRHVVALVVGIGLGYFCFGYQISHLVVQATLSYIIMNTVSPQIMHRVVLFVSLLYLSSMHLLRLTYDYGGWTVDITGPMMITTQKVTSLAFSLHDGLAGNAEKLILEQRKHAISPFLDIDLRKLTLKGFRPFLKSSRKNRSAFSGLKLILQVVMHSPTVLEFFSYIFHFQALMCGPLIFYNDYVDFIEGRSYMKCQSPTGSFSEKDISQELLEPSPNAIVTRKVCVSILCALFLVTVVPYFPITYLTETKFLNDTPWYSKMVYLLLATSVVRSKYYHAWLLGEAVCNASGMGFNGYTPDGKSKWDLISNIDIIRFELSLNFRETLEAWNKSTQVWLRTIAYNRAKTHKTLWTYILSALWHGFYPGYYFTFLGGAIFTLAARSIRRSMRHFFQESREMAVFYDVLTCLTTRIALAYVVFPFILLECNASLLVYRKLYFAGHLAALAAIFILPVVIPPPRTSTQSASIKKLGCKASPHAGAAHPISTQLKKEE